MSLWVSSKRLFRGNISKIFTREYAIDLFQHHIPNKYVSKEAFRKLLKANIFFSTQRSCIYLNVQMESHIKFIFLWAGANYFDRESFLGNRTLTKSRLSWKRFKMDECFIQLFCNEHNIFDKILWYLEYYDRDGLTKSKFNYEVMPNCRACEKIHSK